MRYELRPAATCVLAMTFTYGLLFPLAIWGVSRTPLPAPANLMTTPDGKVIGSEVMAQQGMKPEYFHPRPLATSNGSERTSSGGSDRTLGEDTGELAAAYRRENGMPATAPVPGDALTPSPWGLDPEISPTNAALQAARVARARGLPVERVRAMMRAHTEDPQLWTLGPPRVNVLLLNLDLDKQAPVTMR